MNEAAVRLGNAVLSLVRAMDSNFAAIALRDFQAGAERHGVDPWAAMLWIRCALLPVTDAACPECLARGGPWIWSYRFSARGLDLLHVGARVGEPVHLKGGLIAWPVCLPCTMCDDDRDEPTGRVPRSWGAVFSSAEEWERVPADLRCDECGEPALLGRKPAGPCVCSRHAPTDRLELMVKADELESGGDPLGVWLAMRLSDVPCPDCADGCDACCGTGRSLGRHTQEMIEQASMIAARGMSQIGST